MHDAPYPDDTVNCSPPEHTNVIIENCNYFFWTKNTVKCYLGKHGSMKCDSGKCDSRKSETGNVTREKVFAGEYLFG
jgi:hypothetical protein